jgi:hypothetical protein
VSLTSQTDLNEGFKSEEGVQTVICVLHQTAFNKTYPYPIPINTAWLVNSFFFLNMFSANPKKIIMFRIILVHI